MLYLANLDRIGSQRNKEKRSRFPYKLWTKGSCPCCRGKLDVHGKNRHLIQKHWSQTCQTLILGRVLLPQIHSPVYPVSSPLMQARPSGYIQQQTTRYVRIMAHGLFLLDKGRFHRLIAPCGYFCFLVCFPFRISLTPSPFHLVSQLELMETGIV